MKLTFVTHESDEIARDALMHLTWMKHECKVVSNADSIPQNAVVLFSVESLSRNRYIRLASHRMAQEGITVPDWAMKSPFRVAISAKAAEKRFYGHVREALEIMARQYEGWGPWMKKPDAPWRPTWNVSPHEAFPAWRRRAEEVLGDTPCLERLGYRLTPIFKPTFDNPIEKLIVTGCALFNQPHTDVVDVIPGEKKSMVLDGLEMVVHDAAAREVGFIVPRRDLLIPELRDHFHMFMYMSVADVEKYLGKKIGESGRIFGAAHAHARSDEEIGLALDRSGDAIAREIVVPLAERTGRCVKEVSWLDYIGPYVQEAARIAEKYVASAEAIYQKRVASRPSYASLHKIDSERGLRRTIANNVFYLAEAMYLRDNPDTAIVNCEFEDAFWRGLEDVLAKEVWGDFRPYIGMVPQALRQPWGY